jgi:hypothetical protein
MALPNIFMPEVANEFKRRIDAVTPASKPIWGTMNATQMLAHCNITYEYAFDERHDKPNFLVKIMLKKFVKPIVTNEVPYKKNSKTAPAFIISDSRNFEVEKQRLFAYLDRVVEKGSLYFAGKKSISFDELSATEWNNMFYKHLDHHLQQFGV